MSHFCIAHRVRWVAQLYQKTSLVLCRWVTQASSTGLPESFTCPATLDRPGRLGARSLHLSDLFWSPGRLDFAQTARSLHRLFRLDFLRLCLCRTSFKLRVSCFHPFAGSCSLRGATSDYCVTHHRHKPRTEGMKETAHRETKPATETHQRTYARPRQPCGCPVRFVSSLSFDLKLASS